MPQSKGSAFSPKRPRKTAISPYFTGLNWRKRLRVEHSPPAQRGKQPVLKTGRATGPRSLPALLSAVPGLFARLTADPARAIEYPQECRRVCQIRKHDFPAAVA